MIIHITIYFPSSVFFSFRLSVWADFVLSTFCTLQCHEETPFTLWYYVTTHNALGVSFPSQFFTWCSWPIKNEQETAVGVSPMMKLPMKLIQRHCCVHTTYHTLITILFKNKMNKQNNNSYCFSISVIWPCLHQAVPWRPVLFPFTKRQDQRGTAHEH